MFAALLQQLSFAMQHGPLGIQCDRTEGRLDTQRLRSPYMDIRPASACWVKEQSVEMLQRFGPEAKVFNKGNRRSFGNVFTWIEYYWLCTKFILSYHQFTYLVFYISISIMGFFTNIAYCFHLFDLIVRVLLVSDLALRTTGAR